MLPLRKTRRRLRQFLPEGFFTGYEATASIARFLQFSGKVMFPRVRLVSKFGNSSFRDGWGPLGNDEFSPE